MSLDARDRRRWWALGLLSIAQFLVITSRSAPAFARTRKSAESVAPTSA